MKTSKNKSIIISCFAFAMVWLIGVSCENQTSIVDPQNNRETQIDIREAQIEANFNPQPEPPPKVYEFEIFGDPDGDWTGDFSDFREERIRVITLSSIKQGNTIHVVQTWMIVPPEPIFPPEPIVSLEPVQISLNGIINVANGNVVLNGMSEALGVNVHVRGQAMTLESGNISIGGELMFNPQPEPPPSPGAIVPRGR